MNHKKRTNKAKLKIVSIATAPLLIGAGVFLAMPAFADGAPASNGQQVRLCQSVDTDFTQAIVSGQNQNNETVFAGPVGVIPSQCTTVSGNFWVGTVTIQWLPEIAQDPTKVTSCNVPQTNDNGSVVTCDGP